jgi:signal transduction histidine kinase
LKTSGITKRWIFNTFSIVVILLAVVVTSLMIAVKNYFYSAVEMTLSSQYSDTVAEYFSQYAGSSEDDFETGALNYVENYSKKDKIGVWVINSKGKVVVSSTGFKVSNANIPEYTIAKASKTRIGTFTGKLDTGEKIMAMTFLLPQSGNEDTGAVRYMISLDDIDNEIISVLLVAVCFSVIVIALVLISGLFFVNSIVVPVRKINETAKEIAKGDLNARIEIQGNSDEIAELAGTINFMANELSYTDKMRNDFISTVSHEMRTPLTAIQGWGETLLSVGDTDPALTKRGIEVIIEESGRLTGVVEDLLDLSKIQSGRLSMKREKIDVLAELDDAVFVFKDRSMREGIDLQYNVPNVPAPMTGDPGRIKQVFVNILDNAFKYNHQGGSISVSASLERTAPDSSVGRLLISFADTGCGIPQEDLPKVTEKFYKSNITVPGSGIGLAVCSEIVKLHDGTLDIQSEKDKGTTVTVGFTVDYLENADDTPLARLEQAAAEGNDNAGSQTT